MNKGYLPNSARHAKLYELPFPNYASIPYIDPYYASTCCKSYPWVQGIIYVHKGGMVSLEPYLIKQLKYMSTIKYSIGYRMHIDQRQVRHGAIRDDAEYIKLN